MTRSRPTLGNLFERLYDTFDDWAVERRVSRRRPPVHPGIALRVSPEVALFPEVIPMASTVYRVDVDFEPVPPGIPPEQVARQLLRLVLDGEDLDEVEVPLDALTFEILPRFDVGEQLTVRARYQNAAGVDGPEFTATLEPFAEPIVEPVAPPAHPGITLRVTPEPVADEDDGLEPGDTTADPAG